MGQMKRSRAAVEIDVQRKHFPAAAGKEGQPAAPCGARSWGQVWSGNRCSYRGWIKRHHGSHGKVLLKLDFANIFKSICQTALTRTVSTFPGIARWVTWCYQHLSTLRFGAAAPCCLPPLSTP